MKDLPKGFDCVCGVSNKYPPYVFAHWTDSLDFTCQCGRKYTIKQGRARLLKPKKGPGAK